MYAYVYVCVPYILFNNCGCMYYVVFVPRIITHPTDAYAAAPFSAVFNCSFISYDYQTITWYRNNMLVTIPSYVFKSSVNVTTSILTIIPNVPCEDNRIYHCEVWAGKTGTRSQKANLYCIGKILLSDCAVAMYSYM